ncbi:MAG TPA: FprA family A-type flavoprotein, partial [Bacilli bacterium]|nr:FprA family A-type flavoprotein [Bacilli bacterium]
EYLAIGAPTFNSTILSKMAGFLSYLKGLKPLNKKYIAFGSYGWGGESVKEIEGILESIGHEKLTSFREFHKPTKARLQEITKEVEELL